MQHQETAQSKKQSNRAEKGNFSHWDKVSDEAQELEFFLKKSLRY